MRLIVTKVHVINGVKLSRWQREEINEGKREWRYVNWPCPEFYPNGELDDLLRHIIPTVWKML